MHGDATANPDHAGLKGRGDAWAAAEAYGCDMSLIEGSLRKTPRERIHAHCRALATAVSLRNAMEAMGRPRDREAIVQLQAIRERTSGE